VRLLDFGPALPVVGGLIFAVSGYTMWLSAAGRFRWRVLGIAVLVTLPAVFGQRDRTDVGLRLPAAAADDLLLLPAAKR